MRQKEIELTFGILAKKEANEELLAFFKKQYPNGSVTLSEVLRDLYELANTETKDVKLSAYVGYAFWLLHNFPPTQAPLFLKLTKKFLVWNGNVNITSGINGERFIIVNGDLNIEGDINLTGHAKIWVAGTVNAKNITAKDHAKIWAKTVDAKNITANGNADIWSETVDAKNIEAKGHAVIWADETMDAINIAANGDSEIGAKKVDVKNIVANGHARTWSETVDAKNIAAFDHAVIWSETIDAIKIEAYEDARIEANEINTQYITLDDDAGMEADKTVNAINIAAKGHSGIWAKKINVQNIIDDYRVRIHGDINLINPPQTNPQNTNTAS